MKDQIDKLAKESYYLNPDMIRFLLIENLALKALLHEKGLIDPDVYKKFQEESGQVIDKKVFDQIEEWKKSNPKVLEMFANSTDITQDFPVHAQSKDDVVVV